MPPAPFQYCVICGHASEPLRLAGEFFTHCPSCRYAQLDTGSGAQEDYWSGTHGSAKDSSHYFTIKRRHFESVLETFENAVSGRRLLDIGGGTGHFAELALARAWDAYTFDISGIATAAAVSRVGPARVLSTLDTFEQDSLDVISLWCVIAHTRSPGTIVQTATRLLRPGGVIWVTTPNFSFQKIYARLRFALGRPLVFAAEDHVGHFTYRSLAILLKKHGFSPPIPQFHGIAEVWHATGSSNRVLIAGKRAFNRSAWGFARLGMPNLMSELQVLSTKID